ncbi:hypothetical protein ADEAN_000518700 [Angomonas deanei]|uniref:Uncharacterized protein n=1 Tax=Angomonas deanei TaxID=59799 RepID=A0A7G2CFA4_9TRYP|nr:hypothetical protein ADEAN_000518700 [Angomonas deanei]
MYTTKDAIMAYAALTQRQQPTDSASLFADYFSICKQYSDTPVARETHQMYVKRVDHLRELLRQQRLKKPLLHKPDAPAAGDSLRPVSSSSNMNNNNSMSRGSSRGNASLVSDTSRSPPTLTGITAVTKRLGGNHNEEGDTNSTNNGMEASLNSAEGTEANAQGDLLSPGSSLSRRSTTSAGGVSTRTTAHMVNSFSNSLSTGTATEASLKNVSGSHRNTASSYVILRSEWGPGVLPRAALQAVECVCRHPCRGAGGHRADVGHRLRG